MSADDTKIWRKAGNQDDHWILQRDINCLLNWAHVNKMKIHPSKSHVLTVSNLNGLNSQRENFVYAIDDNPIDYTDLEKDLGIHSKLDWSKRTCNFTKNVNELHAFYLCQVRSQFKHCTNVWRWLSATMTGKIESIHKRALKWVLKNEFMGLANIRVYYQKMMSQTMKRYQTKQSVQRDLQEVRRKEIQQLCSQLNVLLVNKMNGRVEGAYINQKKLQSHTRQLQYNSANLQKQSEQWLKLLDNFNEALKEIGDVSNWAKSLEDELTKISHTLAYAYKGEVEQNQSNDLILE
ncbi:hypothetical protein ACHWQZ_G005706 [Mnemiopsis leidyi]